MVPITLKTSEHYLGGEGAFGRDVEHMFETKVPHNKQANHHDGRHQQMKYKAYIKYALLHKQVASPFMVVEVTLGGGRNRRANKAQQGYYAAYDVENTKIGLAKRVENQTRGIQDDEYGDEHPPIQETRILYYSFCNFVHVALLL